MWFIFAARLGRQSVIRQTAKEVNAPKTSAVTFQARLRLATGRESAEYEQIRAAGGLSHRYLTIAGSRSALSLGTAKSL